MIERSCALLVCLLAGCSGGGGDAGFPFAGSCVLTASAISGNPSTYEASAEFGNPVTPPAFCQGGTAAGSCCLYTGGGPDAGAVGAPPVSAGTLSVTEGTTPIATLHYDVGTSSYPRVAQANPWGAGAVMSWSGDGEVAGTFTGSVTAPALITGLNPDPGANPLGVTLPRNADLTLLWTPDALSPGARMRVDLNVGMPVQFSTLIRCEVDDSAGSVVVPMSLMTQLAVNSSGYILYQRSNEVTVDGHNVSVSLIAQSTAYGAATFK